MQRDSVIDFWTPVAESKYKRISLLEIRLSFFVGCFKFPHAHVEFLSVDQLRDYYG